MNSKYYFHDPKIKFVNEELEKVSGEFYQVSLVILQYP
jgi:hypothetical protein